MIRVVLSSCLRRQTQTQYVVCSNYLYCRAFVVNHLNCCNAKPSFFSSFQSSSTSNSISQVAGHPPSDPSGEQDCACTDDECYFSGEECSFDENSFSGEEYSFDEKIKWGGGKFGHTRYRAVLPLIQVFSVLLQRGSHDYTTPCQIYGSIRATGAQGGISNLYTRSPAKAETVPNQGALSLLGGHDSFITYAPANNTTIDFDLKDKSRDTVVIKKKHFLHSATQDFEDSSNKLMKDIVCGDCGFALIYYTKFLYAVPALVQVAIFSKRDTACRFVDVYGNITVGYGNAREYCNNEDEAKYMKSTLFSKTIDQTQRVLVGRTMKLSRFEVAMPAYSSLIIQADISDCHGRLAAGSVEFHSSSHRKKLIDGEFGGIAVIVELLKSGYSEFIPEVTIEENCEYVGEANLDKVDALTGDSQAATSNQTDYQKSDLVLFDQQQKLRSPPLGSTPLLSSMPRTSEIADDKGQNISTTIVAEVFSLYVGGTNQEVSALCGNIFVGDCFIPDWNLFERGLDNPDFLSQRKGFASVGGHNVIDCSYAFNLTLNLIDPIANKEVCSVSFSSLPYCDGQLFDKRICSFIKGAHGYVLLHYIVFYEACQATVEIAFLSDHPSSMPVNICGSVFASYNIHTYSTMYEKKYYRSRLFDRPQTEFVQLDPHFRIPLSKSAVAVPEGAALVIEVELQATYTSNEKDHVSGKKEFKIKSSKTMREEILGKYHRVQISTKLRGV